MKAEVFFTRRKSAISTAIAVLTRCKASHTGIRIGNDVWEARGDGDYNKVIKGKWDEMIADKSVRMVWTAPLGELSTDNCLQWLDKKVGTKYDYVNTLLLQLLKIRFGILFWQRRDSRGELAYGCGELVADCIKHQSVKYRITKPIAYYSPADLFKIVKPTQVKP